MKFWFIVLFAGCASTEALPRGYVISQHNQEAAIKYLRLPIDQALDAVARTFGGIVISETCAERSGKRLVSLDFVQGCEPLMGAPSRMAGIGLRTDGIAS